ncbi:peptide chain release factor 2 [Desulfatiglans anilini]|uniref:peptide chain release factor 2 n=1 Tax=Desulfatiglans anilini TaxID=90728 RepID=UPI001FC99B7E
MSQELLERIDQVTDSLYALRGHLDLDARSEALAKLEKVMAMPDFWQRDQDEVSNITQERAALSEVITLWERFAREAEEARIMAEMALEEKDEKTLKEVERDLDDLEKEILTLEFQSILGEPDDKRNAIVAINAGAGGTEAQDWVEMLFRMYARWSEQKGLKVQVIDYLEGEEAGIKNITFTVQGPYAYGYLKSEHGIHRMVRISPFDATGRRHTSFASVSVLPEVAEDIVIDIDEKDLRIDTFRASGPGGQHVNKTSSAIRITHLPTNIVVQCQNEKSQHRNKDMAMKVLRSKLYEIEREKQEQKKHEIHHAQKEIAWGSQIRSYVFNPYRLVKDHRTNAEIGNVERVMDGDIDLFIDAYLKQGRTAR